MRSRLSPITIGLLALLLAACRGGGDGGSASLPELTPFNEGLNLKVASIALAASEVRGLPIHEVESGTVSRDKLTAYYEEAAQEARSEEEAMLTSFNTAFRLLHMIEPGSDLLDVFTDFHSSVLGFYAIEEDSLVLVGEAPDRLSLGDEGTLAHEIVHSFQDGEFDIGKFRERADEEEEEKANTEYAETTDALIEGDATFSMTQYIKDVYGEDELRAWASSSSDDADEAVVPPAIDRYFMFPYTYGLPFVRYLHDNGGWEAVNAAYDDPPSTTEQVLHPEKYEAREEAIPLSLRDLSDDLGAGWQQQMDDVFGEFDVYNWLRSTLESEFQSASAAAGWGGGRLAIYTDPDAADRVLLHMALTWDDRDEAREFFAAFAEVLRTIDETPTPLHASLQIVGWDAEDEAGRAWIDGTSFQMVVTVRPEYLATALSAVDAPDGIPASGVILGTSDGSGTARSRIRRLEDVLLQPGDLPPGFVVLQSGDTGVESPFAPGGFEQRFVFLTDARSQGEGVVAMAITTPEPTVLWDQLTEDDVRLLYETMAAQYAGAGDVTSFSILATDGIGDGALGARAEITVPGAPPQTVEMVFFGRGSGTGIVITIHSPGAEELDVMALARTVDERLQRYRP